MVGDATLDTPSGKRVHTVPWEGSFFTSNDTVDRAIVMGGLRGRMFRTEDLGANWEVVEKPPTSALVDSTRLSNDNLVFVGIAGEVLLSTDNGHSFSRLPINPGGMVFTVAEGSEGTLLLGGPSGIQKVAIPQ